MKEKESMTKWNIDTEGMIADILKDIEVDQGLHLDTLTADKIPIIVEVLLWESTKAIIQLIKMKALEEELEPHIHKVDHIGKEIQQNHLNIMNLKVKMHSNKMVVKIMIDNNDN